ncbi:golgi SNAP receptor complex member bos1 [Thelephora ganbajun]|uniref:Golgi SNAP receptor complex member bos1 n=1 Tax=Thelephora ganbajun TaxID=370292 RepID=A0ACB6ZEP4_THEGA|nr:golgi SNAP receptor complex member bos1 [Thelephora ganbajun]
MNSLYTLGVRQTNSIQADLERLRTGDASASLLGQISASLAAMNRTVEDYDSMAKREMIKAKQEKAVMRVQKFRSDYNEFKTQFERLKAEKTSADRTELLGTSTSTTTHSAGVGSSSDTRRRFAPTNPSMSSTPNRFASESPGLSESPFSQPPNFMAASREEHALREHSFIQSTESALDDFIAQGRAVLDDLVDQRNVLKGTQKRLLDAANALGMSRDVISWIERRSTQDMYIFIAGTIFTFFCFYLILRYFG